MTRLALLLLILVIGLATLVILNDDATNVGLPLVRASQKCPQLQNPCGKVDCNRRPTGRIA